MYLLAVFINVLPFILFGFIIKPTGEAGMLIILTLITSGFWLLAYLPYLALNQINGKYLSLLFLFVPSILIFGIIRI
ncbi:hypothetical protein LCGC14_0051990 [marine sediment metagenome]|uniref:Uncharacterized protein n=1 Tax=marine sediment metagenome TaxID=412755 RepID=A0A0F9Y7G0_9ZZZZ